MCVYHYCTCTLHCVCVSLLYMYVTLCVCIIIVHVRYIVCIIIVHVRYIVCVYYYCTCTLHCVCVSLLYMYVTLYVCIIIVNVRYIVCVYYYCTCTLHCMCIIIVHVRYIVCVSLLYMYVTLCVCVSLLYMYVTLCVCIIIVHVRYIVCVYYYCMVFWRLCQPSLISCVHARSIKYFINFFLEFPGDSYHYDKFNLSSLSCTCTCTVRHTQCMNMCLWCVWCIVHLALHQSLQLNIMRQIYYLFTHLAIFHDSHVHNTPVHVHVHNTPVHVHVHNTPVHVHVHNTPVHVHVHVQVYSVLTCTMYGCRCVQWNLCIVDTIGTHATCPDYRGVLNSEVPLYGLVTFGTRKSVLIIEVSLFQVSTVGGSTVYTVHVHV